jgi:hypothetical protein
MGGGVEKRKRELSRAAGIEKGGMKWQKRNIFSLSPRGDFEQSSSRRNYFYDVKKELKM